MSFRRGNLTVIVPTDPAKCDMCGKIDELRPYGPHGENICYECGQKNPEATERQMDEVLFGERLDS